MQYDFSLFKICQVICKAAGQVKLFNKYSKKNQGGLKFS